MRTNKNNLNLIHSKLQWAKRIAQTDQKSEMEWSGMCRHVEASDKISI